MDRKPPPPSNSVQIWMPLYIGDYLGDTIGLSKAQHGSYLLSLMAYWRKGESLTEIELRDISDKDFDRISKFYILSDGRFYHKRVDIELAKARDFVLKQKAKSQKGVAARRASGSLPQEPAG